MEEHKIITQDNYVLIGHSFEPTQSNGKLILINPATAVPQRFYFHYAHYLAAQGYIVFTYDYRGIGLSKHQRIKGFKASMRDWASKDLQAIVYYLNANFASHKKILMGHSFGGNCLGMSEAATQFDAYITIAAQFGYWRYFNRSYQPLLLWVFYILIPVFVRLFGYFPSKSKGLGEPLPSQVALDWALLITHPKSMLALSKKTGNYYPNITQPMLIMSFSDDQMAPKRAVDQLAKQVYTQAQVERRHITAKPRQPIGHLNFFRKSAAKELWPITDQWLTQLAL